MADRLRQLLFATGTLTCLLLPLPLLAQGSAQDHVAGVTKRSPADLGLIHWDGPALRALAAQGDGPEAALAAAYAAFLAGDYEGALSGGQQAGTEERLAERASWLVSAAGTWQAVFATLEAVPGPPGLRLHVPAGQGDWGRRIASFVHSHVAVYRDYFGLPEDLTIQVAFLPDVETLARVSGVPATRLTRSGTVGTTLFGTIFLLSPGAWPNGYDWAVVLRHEAVHEALHRRAPGRLPHLLEEGIARLLEDWSATGQYRDLLPMERALLFLANQEKLLLTEEALTAPFWDLVDGRTVRIAFLQGLIAARLVMRKGPEHAVARLVDALADGEKLEAALERLTGMSEAVFWSRVRGRWQEAANREYLPSLLYSDERDFLSERGRRAVGEARRTVLLADLLWGRGHLDAALQLVRRLPDELQVSPDVAWRMVRLLLLSEAPEEAARRADEALARHPRDGRLLLVAAQAARALGQAERAVDFARRAWLVNPFALETGAMIRTTAGEQDWLRPLEPVRKP